MPQTSVIFWPQHFHAALRVGHPWVKKLHTTPRASSGWQSRTKSDCANCFASVFTPGAGPGNRQTKTRQTAKKAGRLVFAHRLIRVRTSNVRKARAVSEKPTSSAAL
jgi:hypothetical protein